MLLPEPAKVGLQSPIDPTMKCICCVDHKTGVLPCPDLKFQKPRAEFGLVSENAVVKRGGVETDFLFDEFDAEPARPLRCFKAAHRRVIPVWCNSIKSTHRNEIKARLHLITEDRHTLHARTKCRNEMKIARMFS